MKRKKIPARGEIGLEAMEEKFDTERNEGAKNAGK